MQHKVGLPHCLLFMPKISNKNIYIMRKPVGPHAQMSSVSPGTHSKANTEGKILSFDDLAGT